ncbi:MAG: hypothetical protein B6226_04195 [Candidatus Cloacimonetes bacterium 4572_65]|nr:MAG: hypothetical protein B6226_04195 [Candidatus Cloacimonetes bacterium 4572_65]
MKVGNQSIEDDIVKEAKKMLLESDVKSLNMSKLANKCNVAKATLYKMIGSKEDLLSIIALDFYQESFELFFTSYIDLSSFVEIVNEGMLSLEKISIGKMRILEQQIFREYPKIKQKVDLYIVKLENRVVKKLEEFQQKKIILNDIDLRLLVELIKQTLVTSIESNLPDREIKAKLVLLNKLVIRGLLN